MEGVPHLTQNKSTKKECKTEGNGTPDEPGLRDTTGHKDQIEKVDQTCDIIEKDTTEEMTSDADTRHTSSSSICEKKAVRTWNRKVITDVVYTDGRGERIRAMVSGLMSVDKCIKYTKNAPCLTHD